MIEKPVISNYSRDVAVGTCDVSVTDQLLTIEVYGCAIAGGATAPVFLAGSRVGDGEVTLDLTTADNFFDFTAGEMPFCVVFAVAKDGSGNYGPPSDFAFSPLFDFSASGSTITMSDRSEDGTNVIFTVADLEDGAYVLIFYTSVSGDINLSVASEDGTKTITGLDPNTTYVFIILELTPELQLINPQSFRSQRNPYTPVSSPSPAFLRRFLKQDAVYWACDGFDAFGQADLADPIQIKCRWQDQEVLFSGANGEQMLSVAKVYPDRQLTLDGYLMRGTMEDLSSDQSPDYSVNAFPIRAREEHADLHSKNSHLIVWLQKKIVSGKVKGGG